MANIDVCCVEQIAETYHFQSTLTKNGSVNRFQKGGGQTFSCLFNVYIHCFFCKFWMIFKCIVYLKGYSLAVPLVTNLRSNGQKGNNTSNLNYVCSPIFRQLSNDFYKCFLQYFLAQTVSNLVRTNPDVGVACIYTKNLR